MVNDMNHQKITYRSGMPVGLDDGNLPSSIFWAFFIDFSVIWFVIWIWTNGPMRVPLIRWRFFGGRIV